MRKHDVKRKVRNSRECQILSAYRRYSFILLKNQVNEGAITIEQAKETLNNYRNSVGLFKSMPEGLDIEGKKNAMNLLKEKKDLENQIIGKDPALVKKQKGDHITYYVEDSRSLEHKEVI